MENLFRFNFADLEASSSCSLIKTVNSEFLAFFENSELDHCCDHFLLSTSMYALKTVTHKIERSTKIRKSLWPYMDLEELSKFYNPIMKTKIEV